MIKKIVIYFNVIVVLLFLILYFPNDTSYAESQELNIYESDIQLLNKYLTNKTCLNQEQWQTFDLDDNNCVNVFDLIVAKRMYKNKLDNAILELPTVYINTNDMSISSKTDYTNMTFAIENCENEFKNVSGGIRLRGNSTSAYTKKAYRIKFDKKQALFGLKKAKSWVLLAEYLDPSGLHNYTAFSIAQQFEGLSFTPSPYKVNVYLNGKFIGLYTLCEQVQENEGRMDIELDKITEKMQDLKDFNFYICMDASVASDPTAVLNETFFYLKDYDKYFELKYPEKSDFVSEEQFELFFTQLKNYTEEILDAFSEQDIAKIKSEVNMESLVDYLIVDQIMGERDHFYKSFNMYFTTTSKNENENNKLNFGPVWDYDWSLYTPWTGAPNTYYEVSDQISYSNIFFQTVANVPEFYTIVKERWQMYGSNVLNAYINNYDDIVNTMNESIALNDSLYYTECENLSKNNIVFLKSFLIRRKELLDGLWGN